MKLIVGLGNPGKEYERTRHNMGFIFIDEYASRHCISINIKKFNGEYGEFQNNGEKIVLLKPLSYMNLSGEVVRKYLDYFKIDISDILIISDDLDLPFLSFKLKKTGSSGGHNGLKNIEQKLNTKDYKRLKIGISNDKKIDTKDYVLSRISNTDMEKINDLKPIINEILDDFITNDFEKVMSKYNTKEK